MSNLPISECFTERRHVIGITLNTARLEELLSFNRSILQERATTSGLCRRGGDIHETYEQHHITKYTLGWEI